MWVPSGFGAILMGTLLLVLGVDGLNVGVVPFPEPSRFTPMLAIIKELLIRGHEFEVYVPEEFMNNCLREVKHGCVTVGTYNGSYRNQETLAKTYFDLKWINSFLSIEGSTRKFGIFFESAPKNTLQKSSLLPDVVIIDIGLWDAERVFRKYQIPTVFLWSLTQWPSQMNPLFPARGSGFSMRMNLIERWKNYLFQRLNYWVTQIRKRKMTNSSDSFEIILYERHIITPFVFGIDLPQPYCPNVHPVGFLFPPVEGTADNDTELKLWMHSCSNGIIFINLGPIYVLSDTWKNNIDQFIDILIKKLGMCVLWETHGDRNTHSVKARNKKELIIIDQIPFSSRSVLGHGNTRVFLSNCGNFSVYESIESGIPMVGLPLVSEQADMCSRVKDAGVGIVLDKYLFSSHQLFDAVVQVVKNSKIQEKLLSIKRMGYVLGGPKRATDIIEQVGIMGKGTDVMFCRWARLSLIERLELDIIFILSSVGAAFLFIIMKMCSRGKSAIMARKKQD
ncbi:UDP-glucuronosyl/UDP-glucosyltransferase [Trypanosoma melophagium]|uniref:UDP-glucuronosyl/UDP-glucosyltransferase n=1 Tax=Trypanosoma melophagium TaxID=715481 RepID=UPI00351A98B3|nr:UDP-glucuronosyl/UDP-glucosyltransferase [Trypanosoma melophagium]